MPDRESLAGKRILIAEDDFIVAEDVAAQLADLGAITDRVANCADACAALRTVRYDGATLDARLMDGASDEVAHLLKRKAVPCMLVTAYERANLSREMRDLPYLAKPFERVDFVELAARHFGGGPH